MRNLKEIKQFKVFCGSDISEVAREAIAIATLDHCYVEFDFNSVKFSITEYDDANSMVNNYWKKLYENERKNN